MPRRTTVRADDTVVACCGTLGTTVLSAAEADDLAEIFGALADPARLRMLSMIASADEVCSCALEAPLEKSQPTISHHTRILAAAGLIVGERRGRWTWWRAVPERLEAVARSLST
jgi:ArsR family transcriptional regulator